MGSVSVKFPPPMPDLSSIDPADVRRWEDRLTLPPCGPTDDPAIPEVARFGRAVAVRQPGTDGIRRVDAFCADDLPRLSAILDWVRASGPDCVFPLSPPGAVPAVRRALAEAGLVRREPGKVVLHGVPTVAPTHPSAGARFAMVDGSLVDIYLETLADALEWAEPARTAAIATHRRAFPSGALHFLATIEGAPVGVGSIEIRDGIATLVGGGVVPACRGAHLHRWMIAERLAEAARRGASEVLATAKTGSTSLRNLVACGLRPVWTEEIWATPRG